MSFMDARWRLGLKILTLGSGLVLLILLFVLTKEVFLGLPPAAVPKAPGEAKETLYKLFVERPPAENGRGFVSWRVISMPGSKLNIQFPAKLLLAADPAQALTLERTTYAAKDFLPFTETQQAVKIPYTVKGPARLDYELVFGVCLLKGERVESCHVKREKGALPLAP
mgnify:CR=1 FL=1